MDTEDQDVLFNQDTEISPLTKSVRIWGTVLVFFHLGLSLLHTPFVLGVHELEMKILPYMVSSITDLYVFTLQVAAWAERKERNIRAILSSLHEILWEGESRWTEVGMHQLVQPDQVTINP